MQLSDKIKKFSVEQAIDYLNRNPVKNLPKLLDRADTFCAGKFEGQRRAIRKACLAPTDAHYPSVNWDAISSEEYFRQLIDLGCLFIWYFHYMPVGQRRLAKQAAAAAKKKQRTRAKSQRAQKHKKAALPVREALLFEPSPQRGRLGVRVRRGARHRRRWRKPRTASNKKHRLPVGRRCFCTHAVVTTRCRTPARAR